MKNFLNKFFVFLGVIFFIILLGLGYLWVADPFQIKPFLNTMTPATGALPVVDKTTATNTEAVSTDSSDKNPNLNASQEDALQLIGIDPGALPAEITPEQEACFVAKLGAERVVAIKAGATPDVVELFKAKECMAL